DENASNTRTEIVAVPMTTTIPAPTVPTTIVAEPTPDEPPAPVEEKKLTPEEQAQVERQRANEQFLSLLPSVIFGGLNGGNSWPESIALAGELDGDSLVVRALVLKEGDDKPARPIPLVPISLSRPALTPEAASAALGNEIAVAAPSRWVGVGNNASRRQNDNSQGAGGPLIVIALNDKRALQALLPRALEAFGLRGVGEQQLIEKRGDVELLTFSQGTIAFIDRFLVVAPDAATMRHVVDAYNKRETLASSDAYRNAARWQPRQVLGQVYVSSALIKDAFDNPKEELDLIDDAAVRDVLLRLNPEPGAITHALTKDDQGLLHELHIPKEVLALMTADELVSKQLAPLRAHEAQARYALEAIAAMQGVYKAQHGSYGSLADIVEVQNKEYAEREGPNGERFSVSLGNTEAEGYEIKLNVANDKFEVTATPTTYRKTGRLSFYIDQ